MLTIAATACFAPFALMGVVIFVVGVWGVYTGHLEWI